MTYRTLALALVSTAVLAVSAVAQDKKAAPAKPDANPAAAEKGRETTKLFLENDAFRVTETTYKPGGASAMRERPDRIAQNLTDGTMEKTSSSGRKEVINYKSGDVRFSPRETYTQKNIGKSDYVVFTVNLKAGGKPAAAPAKDAPKADAKAPDKGQEESKRLLDSDRAFVTETTYKPGAASDMRTRGERVSRALSSGQMQRTYQDGKKETITWTKGDVKYFPKETFTQKNVGKTDVVLLTVTLK